jgi:hypothetical protein
VTELFIGSLTEADAERIRRAINPEELPKARPEGLMRCLLHFEPGCEDPRCKVEGKS